MSRTTSRNVSLLRDSLFERSRIRNVCVIAHVDHGKTSLCDHLIASNGYLNQGMAGKFRYMDAREDEQTRMITIKSSAIPLLHDMNGEIHLINLIDSPGHVDFAVEVYAAARLSDAALLVVDVLEGFRAQSKMVMRQAWREGLDLILVLSKMDRLPLEAKYEGCDIYMHIRDLIETVNGRLQRCISDEEPDPDKASLIYDQHAFAPEKGNVIFASALHGWAFTMRHPATLVAREMVESAKKPESLVSEIAERLLKCFWGDMVIDARTGRVRKTAKQENSATKFAFQPIVDTYSASTIGYAAAVLGLDAGILSLPSDTKNTPELAGKMLSMWAPCAVKCLDAIVMNFQDPCKAFAKRSARLGADPESDQQTALLYIAKSMSADIQTMRLTSDQLHGQETLNDIVGLGRIFRGKVSVGDALHICSYEPKVKVATKSDHPSGNDQAITPLHPSGNDQAITPLHPSGNDQAITPLLVSEDSELPGKPPTILSVKPPPESPGNIIYVRGIYIPIGLDLLAVESAGVGCIVAVSFSMINSANDGSGDLLKLSIENTVEWLLSLKENGECAVTTALVQRKLAIVGFNPVDRCVTLAGRAGIKSLESVYRTQGVGLLRFGVSPKKAGDWPRFLRALALLYRADPAVDIDVQEQTGEFIICCQGHVHRERIVQDFKNLYGIGIEIIVSPPLVAVREGIIQISKDVKYSQSALALPYPPWASPEYPDDPSTDKAKKNGVEAYPMPEEMVKWMDIHRDALTALFHENRVVTCCMDLIRPWQTELILSKLSKSSPVEEWSRAVLHITKILASQNNNIPSRIVRKWTPESICLVADSRTALFSTIRLSNTIMKALISGFQAASVHGPMTEEPVRAVIFVLTGDETTFAADEDATSGTYIGLAKTLCRKATVIRGANRLFELMLRVDITCEESNLGKVCNLLSQKRSDVQSETMDEKTMEFRIVALLPSTESSDFSVDLRRVASGKASITFEIEGWQLNPYNPFPESSQTVEEEEEEGQVVSAQTKTINGARQLIHTIRMSKGLPIASKTVERADKQRTLGRSK